MQPVTFKQCVLTLKLNPPGKQNRQSYKIPFSKLQCEIPFSELKSNCTCTVEFFTVYTKFAEMALLASNFLTIAKKVTSSGA